MHTLGMSALAVLAVVTTVLVVVGALHLGRQRRVAIADRATAPASLWYQFALALLLLAILMGVGASIALEFTSAAGGSADTWRGGVRANLFLGVMVAAIVLGLLFLVVYLLARMPAPVQVASVDDAREGADLSPVRESAGATRLLGLLLFAVGILLLGWLHLEPVVRAALVSDLLYPAAIAVALVLLFDKATRSWTPRTRAEGFREWLLADLMVFALVLGYLNLLGLPDPASYAGFGFDLLHIAVFFAVLWLLDRTNFSGRFLVAVAYFTLLPLLLLLWQWAHEIEAPAELSWWQTIWPVFFLSLVFLGLEVIALLAFRGARGHMAPAIKDALYVVLFAAFLISAIPATE